MIQGTSLVVELDDEELTRLRRLSAKFGRTPEHTARRALAIYMDLLEREGKEIYDGEDK